MFPPVEYVEWLRPRIDEAEFDLGSSDLRPEAADGVVVPERLDGLSTPDASLEDLVADAHDVLPERVLVTAGASSANLLAVATALALDAEGGDTEVESNGADGGPKGRILVEKPGYEPHVGTPRGFGATVDRFHRPPEDGFALDPGRVEGALVDRTTLVTVSNRHNPSGTPADRGTLAACADAAGSVGARLHVDEVYSPYGREGDGPGFGGESAAGLSNTVVTGSLTKFWGFGALRIGWLVADRPFIRRAERMAPHLSDVAGPSRTLARRALSAREMLLADARERCARNHDLLRSFIERRAELTGVIADGAPFGLVSHVDERIGGDTLAATAWEAGVLVVPGRFFGVPGSVRVALGHPPDACEAALDAFGDALADV